MDSDPKRPPPFLSAAATRAEMEHVEERARRRSVARSLARIAARPAPDAGAQESAEINPAAGDFSPADWRTLGAEERERRIGHVFSLVRAAEHAGRDPPSWRELERASGVSRRKLQSLEPLAEAHRDAEHAAQERRQERLNRHATR
jgi:hypothetical protein